MELGSQVADGKRQLFSLNFDIIAHEMGHLILYSQIGLPDLDALQGEFFGFHESGADLVALITVLHFNSVVDHLLESTRGNLYTFNELNRFAELSPNQQIRIAGNATKMSAFAAGWTDEHDLSEPLTGAFFDLFVDLFHDNLVQWGVISTEVEGLMDRAGTPEGAGGRHPVVLRSGLPPESGSVQASAARGARPSGDRPGGAVAARTSRLPAL